MARRSARISSRNSSTPQPIKRVSLSHDAFPVAPHTLPTKLASLREADEMPGSFPGSPSPTTLAHPNKRQRTEPGTPDRANIVPSKEEMHPQATHQSTVKADEEARWLGFSAMSHSHDSKSAACPIVSTPTRTSNVDIATQSPTFKFTFTRQQSLELSPAAKSLMQEKRAEAAKIKEQMKTSHVTEVIADAVARKIATPKSQRSRFSDAHNAQFSKMASISGHASAYRTDPRHVKGSTSPSKTSIPTISATLPSTPSKSNLPTLISTPSKTLATGNSLKRKADVQLTKMSADEQQVSAVDDGTYSARKHVKATTPSHTTAVKSATGALSTQKPASTHATTPTKTGSVSRKESVKSKLPGTRIPEPSTSKITAPPANAVSTPLLQRTPIKASIMSQLKRSAKKPSQPGLLERSPLRRVTARDDEPDKPVITARSDQTGAGGNPFKTETPLQARHTMSSANLLGRFESLRSTPVKSILRTPQRLYSDDPAKVAAGTHLATPPQIRGQRIPATAPVRKHVDFSSSTKAREDVKQASLSPFTFSAPRSAVQVSSVKAITYPALPPAPPASDGSLAVQKRRQSSGPQDFTFRMGNEVVFAPVIATPTKVATPRAVSAYTIRHVPAEPELPVAVPNTTNATKQRKIQFEDAQSTAQTACMSPTLTLGSKKRKFDFENGMAELGAVADKENMPTAEDQNHDKEDCQRPVKRMKQSTASPRPAVKPRPATVGVKPRTTLGVKPKSAVGKPSERPAKKTGTTTISMARLNALAQPKKRS